MPNTPSQLDGVTLKRPIYVIGDIHGRIDLLETLLEKIDADVDRQGYDQPHLIFVGDYIDRGDQSAEVLHRLHALCAEWPDHVTCLRGNHEAMLLSFLRDPSAKGRRWLRFGGLQTLASFRVGLSGFGETPNPTELALGAAQLRDNMGPLVAWLEALPTHWHEADLWVTHAGANPNLPMSAQSDTDLMWGHRDFGRVDRPDAAWVIHGHTIVNEPKIQGRVVSIDTGAYYSGQLTAAALSTDGRVGFIQTL